MTRSASTSSPISPTASCDPLKAGRYLCEAIGNRWTSSVGYSLMFDSLNNRLRPTAGQRLSLSQDFAGLGGDVKYIRSRFEGSKYCQRRAAGSSLRSTPRAATSSRWREAVGRGSTRSGSPIASIWANPTSGVSTFAASARASSASPILPTRRATRCCRPIATRSSTTRWAAGPIIWPSSSSKFR